MATWQCSRRPPPPQYTCCHHLSVARRHSLSQQMRGLSERAPQFLRDCGEEGGPRLASLWFLLTVDVHIQARLPRSLRDDCEKLCNLDLGKGITRGFQCCELICVANSVAIWTAKLVSMFRQKSHLVKCFSSLSIYFL